MSSQHEASAVDSTSAPSHHSGPGYVTNRDTSDFELGDQLREAATRWLNLVPAEHRHYSPASAERVLESLEEHARSCREHPFRVLIVAQGGPISGPPRR